METPEFDYMETIWVIRQQVFEPDIEFMLRVFLLDGEHVLQKFFRPHQVTLLHRLISIECEFSFRSIANNHGVDHLQKYLSFYTKPRINDDQLQQITEQWYGSYLSSLHNRTISYHDIDLLTNILTLNSLTDKYFHILFTDGLFRYKFSQILSNIVRILNPKDHLKYIREDGQIRRIKPPKWLQKGIFKRDKGHCVSCNKDLTGVFSLENIHYDHIISLANFGVNDPINFQLLCQDCNLSKSSKRWVPPQEDLLFW